ncbi:site-specific RNA endonuclease [Serratia phage SP1]|nr:site-specific RNA endonuclease [Serratia phage SP1]
MSAEVHIRRSKIRRMFEQQFRVLNSKIEQAMERTGYGAKFHIKYSPHFLDRVIMRDIEEKSVLDLLSAFGSDVIFEEVMDYLFLPPVPDDMKLDPNVRYRELRLEITNGKLWIGLTADKVQHSPYTYGLCCRMGIVNEKRMAGKTSTRLIDLRKD